MEENSQPKVTVQKKSVGPSYEVFEFCVDGSPEPNTRQVDVLLIHGLTGDPIKTWGGSLLAGNAVSDCWPRKLAIELQSKATFWTLKYPAPLLDKHLGTIRSAIEEEGRAALKELVHAKLGEKPIIFVSYSLGGLLTKVILAESAKCQPSKEREIVENTSAVIFVGTPHAGSPQTKWRFLVPFVWQLATKGVGALVVASVALVMGAIAAGLPVLSVKLFGLTWQATLGGLLATLVVIILGAWGGSWLAPGRHVLMLDLDYPGLRELTRAFRSVRCQHTFFTDSFYEEKALWNLFLVVPWWSADPGVTDCKTERIAADHISMCKDPHAEPLQCRVKDRVKAACRGKGASVFGDELKLLLKRDTESTNAYEVLFEDKDGDRGKEEETFRTFLRETMRRKLFVPKDMELDLAQDSRFDEDAWVWTLWHEQFLASSLRHLRKKAKKEVGKNYHSAPGSRPTLIPFYRCLRTIENICTGDLTDLGHNLKDWQVLHNLITEATKKLEKLCKDDPNVDVDGRTRRLLLRMWCTLQAVSAVQKHVGAGEMEQRGDKLGDFLDQWHTALDDALTKLRNELEPLPTILPPRVAIRRFCESIEGEWWERITEDKGSAISFFRIEIDAVLNSVFLSGGKSYDNEGLHRANWESVFVGVDKDKSKILYHWEGWRPESAKVRFHGLAEIKFDKPAFKGGEGKFWTVDETPENTKVKLNPTNYKRVQEASLISVMTGHDGKAIQSLIKKTLLEW